MEFSIFLVLMTVLAGDPAAEKPRADGANCQLMVDGEHIEKLTLMGKNGRVHESDLTGSILFCAPGQYCLQRVVLQGGYCYEMRGQPEWFTLSPEEPYHLRGGAPLTSHVDVTRMGQLLELDYRLVDAAGRRYRNMERTAPPRFAIYQDGQEIAGGAFEYG
jgi:hypothetical protein